MNKKYEKYINYIVDDIEPPYFKSLEQYGLKQDEMDLVLSKVFNQPVKFVVNRVFDKFVVNRVFDKDNNEIYYERSNGYWKKYEYDPNGYITYIENSDGYWEKYEYDSNGNLIYSEDSDGYCQHYIDKQYIE